jgi:phosphate transport system substrate-binding protein
MFTRRLTLPSDATRRRKSRLLGPAGVLSVLAAGAITLSACSSSSSSSTTPTTAAVKVSSLENWPTTPVSVTESGSTLLQPLFTSWANAIHTSWPTVTVQPGGGGSGQGFANVASGISNIGGSDPYLSQAQLAQYPALENIPLAISAQQVNYNVPNITPAGTHLKLNGKVLSAMYQGTITNWNDSQIAALNPGVHIPSLAVAPIHRGETSGDTFLFTSFLAAADPSGWGTKYPPNTTESWPNVPGSAAATGNGGMVTTCAATPGCVAYIGVSYLGQATTAGLAYAELQNKSGNYELPSATAISAEAAGFANSTPSGGAISMIYGPATDGYPIVNYEYAIVGKQPDAAHAQAVKAVLAWAIDPKGGNASTYLGKVNFVPLPTQVEQISLRLISKIAS